MKKHLAAMGRAFIKMMRSQELLDMLREDPNAFRLLTLIALRTNLFDYTHPYGCCIGEALVSARAVGMNPSPFRTARKKLEKRGVVKFEIRREGSTSRTFARITSPKFFDINLGFFDGELSSSNEASITPRVAPDMNSEISDVTFKDSTTKNKNKTGGKPSNDCEISLRRSRRDAKQEVMKMGKEEIKKALPLTQCSLTQQFILSIVERIEAPIPFILQIWEQEFRKIVNNDGVEKERVAEVVEWVASNDFWRGIILSPTKLREHLPKLLLQMDSKSSKGLLNRKTLQEDDRITFR